MNTLLTNQYFLHIPDKGQSIEVVVSPVLLTLTPLLDANSPIVNIVSSNLDLPAFVPICHETFGYGGCIAVRQDDSHLVYTAPLPERVLASCPACDGSGISSRGGNKEQCFYCSGTGQWWSHDHSKVKPICASLSVLFSWLNYHCDEPPIEIRFSAGRRTDTGSITATLSPDVMTWLNELSEDKYHEFGTVNDSMTHAFMWMDRYNEWDLGKIEAVARDGRMVLECPGDRSGLYAGGGMSGFYDQLLPHNIDTATQKLTLLVGLSKLQDEWRAAQQAIFGVGG